MITTFYDTPAKRVASFLLVIFANVGIDGKVSYGYRESDGAGLVMITYADHTYVLLRDEAAEISAVIDGFQASHKSMQTLNTLLKEAVSSVASGNPGG